MVIDAALFDDAVDVDATTSAICLSCAYCKDTFDVKGDS